MIAISNESADRPLIRTPEQMRVIVERLRTDGYEMDRVNSMLDTAEEKQKLVEQLQVYDPELNGEAHLLAEDIGLYKQELETKKEWNTWEFVKSIPGRVWGTMKAHPYITTATVVGLAAAGLYFYYPGADVAVATGIGRLRDWIGSYMVGNSVAQATEAASEIGGQAVEATQEAAGAAAQTAEEALGGALENVPLEAPPAAPLPTDIPSLDEAGEILKGLE